MEIIITHRNGLPMKVEIKNSGSKHTIKIVPSSTTTALSSIRPRPDPQKGKQNPPHWHIRNPFKRKP